MSLFTQSEASRFHSFLSQVDVSETFNLAEWPLFTDALAVPQTEGTEELSKATRTLMALDSANTTPRNSVHSAPILANRQWPDPPANFQPPPSHTTTTTTFSHKHPLQLQHSDSLFFPPPPPLPQPPVLRHPLLAAIDNASLFFQPQPTPLPLPPPPQSHTQPPTPSSATFPSSQSPPEPESPTNARKRSASGRDHDTGQASAPPKKRARAAAPSSDDGSSSTPTPPRQSKAHLLTTSQKKANHIQSEQKRRANIRQGYESLCEVVPALREAIRAEEEHNIAVASGMKKKTKATRGTDGRAGPKSECAVLQKTIDHITNLVEKRAALIARLNHARTLLHPQHPGRTPILPPSTPGVPSMPLWERQWDGGSGMEDDDDDDDDD